MKLKATGLLITALTVLTACSLQQKQHQAQQQSRFNQHVDAEGLISIEELQTNYPIFNAGSGYQPVKASIESFNATTASTDIKVFLGTWCHDSQREVPRLIKFYNSINNPRVTLTMVALDRSKNDSNGLAQQAEVRYTPTIILYQDNQELGRIIEQSDGPIDVQLANMLPRQK
ncbi:thioredoxin family protein [Kangiella sediminilitoris]|uniref:Putative thioredoxin family protein n=1 Tax=Kangiella sediminilitoris TaxID=1144748 RepID=A0A1B3B8X8_9GAMM|nr:thioredoxin family protein [Kangiella sediminilitoris]AOE49231.1 Putative thioredoxin family protein [Kangiella sediminilitoris]